MKQVYLSWTSKVPTRPGLYVKTDGRGTTRLVAVSVERFMNGDRHAYLMDVTPDFVRGALNGLKRETLHHLKGSHDKTHVSFLGPIKLPNIPTDRKLSRASRTLPIEPGIYFHSMNLGHGWLTQLVSISVHRYHVGGAEPHHELFAMELHGFDSLALPESAINRGVLTLALPRLQELNLQQLRRC